MKNGGQTNYQKQLKGSRDNKVPRNGPGGGGGNNSSSQQSKERTQQRMDGDLIDLKFGFDRFTEVRFIINSLITCLMKS